MLYVVVYDVTDDATRARVAEVLKDYGGWRIQLSAFMLEASKPEVLRVMRRVAAELGSRPGSVLFIPLCSRCRSRVIVVSGGRAEEEGRVL